MNTQEMRQAMGTLRQFSEKDKNYFAYQARQNYIRQQMSVYGELDATKVREQEALAKLDAVTLREQQALEEIEKLKALLAEKNA
jgi:tRNA U34 2-thiouridine synthase MnmA/TrmU